MPLEQNLEDAWKKTLEFFYFPLLHNKPVYDTKTPTAHFDFKDNSIKVSPKFIEELSKKGLDEQTALEGILLHEVGHYRYSPQDMARFLFLAERAKATWGDKWHTILNIFWDAQLNLEIMRNKEGGKPLRELYKTMQELGGDDLFSLINSLYQTHIEEDFGVSHIVDEHENKKDAFDKKPDETLAYRLHQLLKINYAPGQQEEKEWIDAFLFGETIKDLVKKPNFDSIDIGDLNKEQLDDALDKISRRFGKKTYDRIKKFLEEETGHKFDQRDDSKQSSGAGIEQSKIEFNNNHIAYYQRKARTYGLFIQKKPVRATSNDNYPEENIEFQAGDEIKKWNAFQGRKLLPGVSKKKKDNPLPHKDRSYIIPDLFICLDTSGSMPHPANDSDAVLAAFILARNYHANGSKIGIMNFSADSAFLLPTRQLDEAYKMLCAYWGGGTILDTEKVKEYFENIAKGDKRKGYVSTDQDYEKMVKRLTPQEQQKLHKKDLKVNTPTLQEVCEKLDNVIITDGDIHNMDEVVNAINIMAPTIRHTIYVIHNPYRAQEYDIQLPNTQVIKINKTEDLINQSIGKVKKIL